MTGVRSDGPGGEAREPTGWDAEPVKQAGGQAQPQPQPQPQAHAHAPAQSHAHTQAQAPFHARPPAPAPPQAPSRSRLPVVRLLAVVVPVMAGALTAFALALWGPRGTVDLRFSPPGLALLVGVLLAAVIAVVTLGLPALRGRARRREATAGAAAVEAERAAHRRFLARLDHELKNPVTAIRSALTVDGDAPAANVAIAVGQANRLAALVGQLRGLAALESRPLERAPVDLTAIALEEVAAIREEAAARRANRVITTDFPTVPWPLPPVLGDADLLAVAVRNVVLNAVKYSGEGARIEVRGSEDSGFVVLDVADTGAGIRDEDLPFVWDELWRAADARGIEGTGLGLSLVRVVLERHGGDVSLRSQYGRGTSVRLRVPAAR